jgi:hypothetical protein
MNNISKLKPFDKISLVRKCIGLSPIQKLILLVVASHLGKNDFCFLSIPTLLKECGLKHRSSLISNIDVLIKLNILWKLPPDKGFKSNRYGIRFEELVRVADWGSARSGLVGVRYAHPKRKIKRNIKKSCPVDKKSVDNKLGPEDYLEKMKETVGLKVIK